MELNKVTINQTATETLDKNVVERLRRLISIKTGSSIKAKAITDYAYEDTISALQTAYPTFQLTATTTLHKVDFTDDEIKRICTEVWDTYIRKRLSQEEAASKTTLGDAFKNNKEILTFEEVVNFIGLTSLDLSGDVNLKGELSLPASMVVSTIDLRNTGVTSAKCEDFNNLTQLYLETPKKVEVIDCALMSISNISASTATEASEVEKEDVKPSDWMYGVSELFGFPVENLYEAHKEWEEIEYVFNPNSVGKYLHIQSQGNAYIITDLSKSNTLSCEVAFKTDDSDIADKNVIGLTWSGDVPYKYYGFGTYQNKIYYALGSSEGNGGSVAVSTSYVVKYNYDGNIYQDESLVGSGINVTSSTTTNNISFWHRGSSSERFGNDKKRYVYFKENGSIKAMFVPFFRDNTYGMLDLVSNEFYPNSNSVGYFSISYE